MSKTITLYTAVVNSVSLKRNIRVVYVCKRQGTRLLTALLFSTDLALIAEEIYRYSTARFQIEFVFRDAKQYLGLMDFQTRSEVRIAFHVNASLTALNFGSLVIPVIVIEKESQECQRLLWHPAKAGHCRIRQSKR